MEQVANDSDDDYGGAGLVIGTDDCFADIEEEEHFRFEIEENGDIGFPSLDDAHRELQSSGEGSKFSRSSKGRSGRYPKTAATTAAAAAAGNSSNTSGRRVSGSGREQRIKDVVDEVLSLSTKLKIKIQHEIKSITDTDTDDTVQVGRSHPYSPLRQPNLTSHLRCLAWSRCCC